MKTLLIAALLLTATSTKAEEKMILTNNSESEVLGLLFIMCPTCVISHLADRAGKQKQVNPTKVPDSKNNMDKPVERTLASEEKKVSK